MNFPALRPWARAAVLACALVANSARAQPADPELRRLAAQYAAESAKAFEARDYAKAEAALKRQLKLEPTNFVIMYNLGCARAMQDDAPGAADYIVQAVEHGFTDLAFMERDAQLAAVRDQPKIRALRERWPEILTLQAQNNVADARRLFKTGYQESSDDTLKLKYLSAFNAKSSEIAKAELTRIAAWAGANLFEGLTDPKAGADDAWVVVVLPSKADFRTWAQLNFGAGAVQGNSMIAGSYMHDQKRLVAMDLGATLRHEFLHALHWRSTTRLGQVHPIWILEGLGTLVEDYDVNDKGELVPATSWRTNTVKRMEKIAKLVPIETLTSMSQGDFSSKRPLANYAQARAFFLYLSRTGKLAPWYRYYTAHYREDPTGLEALHTVLGRSTAEINADFRAWVRQLPAVPEEITPGMASLGLEIDAGQGEGPVVVSIPKSTKSTPLRLNDTITAIDDRPVRDIAELVRVLSAFKPGDQVTVAYRRGQRTGEASVTLTAR